jgi:hypothetical protein
MVVESILNVMMFNAAVQEKATQLGKDELWIGTYRQELVLRSFKGSRESNLAMH